jgi:hypothetical protein
MSGALYAPTISATTYLGLPIDVMVTGGTYGSGTTVFSNNTGGTFNITGYTYIPHLQYDNSNSTIWNYGRGNLSDNISFGKNALVSTTNGNNNTAFGSASLSANTTGNYNAGIGAGSLKNNTTGVQNFGIGAFALHYNTTGNYNTGIGTAALQNNTGAERNVAIGGFSLYNNTGSRNIAIGFYAGSATKGSDNILLGANAVNSTDGVVSGSNNTIIGTLLSGVINGSNNTIIGKPTGLSSTTTNNIVIADGSGNIRFRDNNVNTILPRLAGSGNRMVVAGPNGELSSRTIFDTFVTGGTYSTGTAVFTNNSGGTFNVTGLTTPFTGGTVAGSAIFTNGLTANTFDLSTTPNTNTTDTDVLVRNQSTGIIEQRSINSLTNVVNLVTVGLTGSTNVDYNSVKEAVDSITGATSANTYVVKVGPGVFYEDSITMKSYVDVIGESETNTIIQANNPNTSLIIGADQSMVSNVQIQGCTGTNVAAVFYSSPTIPQLNAIFYVENVRFGSNYTHAKTVGTGGGNCIMQCSNVKYGGYPFTLGFYVTNDGSGVGRMQLRNVTSTNGGVTTTSGLIFAKADQPSCAFIVNGCLLTKSTGSAAGTGFWVENGGSLRLTAVNFQRWETGIYAPQIGSAPSIEAIALNFENCTKDVNIIHSGATGKIQGTDNYSKTLININAPLYEVNQDPRIITVAKKGGDFTSVKSAIDSITGSSIDNRFLVSVGPGKFTENEIDLTGKPYVSVEGSNIITSQIVPNTNTQHIFKIGQNNEISFLALSGAPIGYAAIYVNDIGDYAQAHKISFTDCDTNVWVESHTQDTTFYGEYLDFNGEYSYGTKIIAYNGYGALANMENYYNFPTGTGTTIANSVQGSGATLSVFVGDGIGNGVSGSTNYQIFDYASLNTMSTTSYNWGYTVRVLNNGGPARFDIDSLSIVDSLVWDLSIEHPNTFGTFGGGSSSHVKINNLSDDIYWAFLDVEDGEFEVTRKISVTFQDGTHTDASTLIFEGATMGLIEGGVITHVSGLTFQVSSGFGYLEKTINNGVHMRIDWDNTQITLLANTENYLYFNENEILSTSSNSPDNINNIILGRAVTDSTTVRFIDATPYNAKHTSNLLSTFNRNALGSIYVTGSLVTENATPYHLNISSGDYYFSEDNFLPSGGTNVNFTQYYRDGGAGWITTGTTEVINGYDDNSGFIATLPLSSFTKHTLYVVGDGLNEEYMLVLGQTYYTTLVEVEGADLPTPPTYFNDSVTSIASIYIQQGFSGITEIQDIRPVIGFKAAGVSASAVHGNLLGLNADDHTQYLLIDGARAMTGNLSMGGNTIFSALTVNGVTVESHASRHQNGGADEIATSTPSASAIPKADTFGKLDGWISDASSSVKGLTRLSVNPLSASVPIAVGDNDSRFLNSFTGGTYSSGTIILNNNTGGTFNITGFTTPFTGGTVTGSTLFTNGLTANTFSATTYLGLPTDIRVTGGTYGSGTTVFTNNTGGTFNISGFSIGNEYWSGGTGLNSVIQSNSNSLAGGKGALAGGSGNSANSQYSVALGINSIADGFEILPVKTQITVVSGITMTSLDPYYETFAVVFAGVDVYSEWNNYFYNSYSNENPFIIDDGLGNTYTLYTYNLLEIYFDGSDTYIVDSSIPLTSYTTISGSPFYDLPTVFETPAFVFGSNSLVTGSNSIVLGNNITGTSDNTTYVDYFNIKRFKNNNIIFGVNSGYGATSASNSNFFGYYAGYQATNASASNFLGYWAGNAATNAYNSNFFGTNAGSNATNANNSNFIGNGAGQFATNAYYSNFIGFQAGYQATSANNSNFFGNNAGRDATSASNSNFIGGSAGYQATNASSSNFFGNNSGYQASGAFASNFFGNGAGFNATSANNSNFMGTNAGVNATGASNSNLFGNQAGANATGASNSNLFGLSAGQNAANAANSNFMGQQAGRLATNASNSNFFGQNAGRDATNAYYSNFMGYQVGYGATNAYYSNFFGFLAGYGATNANDSNFFGLNAGQSATGANNSNFFGWYAGLQATNAYHSNFFGNQAGRQATSANFSNFFGASAGYEASGASGSTFMGQNAGYQATNAYYSNFFGFQAGRQATNATGSTFMGYQAGISATGAYQSNFMGQNAGFQATNAYYSNFFGFQAGYGATNTNNANFFGRNAGLAANSASYSNLFGYNVGNSLGIDSIGSNNIIIGTNISLPSLTTNSINIGGVLFGANTYEITTGIPSISAQTNGKIGINVVNPLEALHVSGNTLIKGSLTANTISATTYLNLPTDIRVTGGTYSAGTAVFSNNTGGTFNITGFSTSTGVSFTGGTVTGSTIFTNGVSASTFSATTYLGLPLDIRVTGGTYNDGTAVFSNNTGGTFSVSGFSTSTGGGETFTGGTVSGATTFTNGLSATTIEGGDLDFMMISLFRTLYNY